MYLLGGHFPYISTMIMRYYSDLVRELASRAGNGWVRVKIDIDYFLKNCKRFASTAVHGSSSWSALRSFCATSSMSTSPASTG
jgi:hypothetical protein